MIFEPTLPMETPELMRASAFRRYLDDTVRDTAPASASRLSSLSPSLMQDLLRFEQDGRQTEWLEVVAASIRHGKALTVHLNCLQRALPLTLFPVERMVHCLLPVEQLLRLPLTDIEVLHVEAAQRPPPPGPGDHSMPPEERVHYSLLGPLSWELALRGARGELLPEIPPSAAYRIPPGVELKGLALEGSLAQAVQRLRRGATNLREMSGWPGFDRERAMRLLNALYLQAGLMVTRTHPAATNDGWQP